MFSKFFIDRPRFAAVISIVLTLAGAIAVFSLPISLYPEITPPEVTVSASYPGASAEVLAQTVGIPIEEEINGVEDMLYMNSTSDNSGNYTLTITFAVGTDPDLAQVKVQNRVQQAQPKLPTEVQRQGVTVTRRSSDILGFISVSSPNRTHDNLFVTNYVQNNMKNNLGRVNGVGDISIYASALSMRVWLDADKISSLNLSMDEVTSAITSQNFQPSLGKVGAQPTEGKQEIIYTLQTTGRLNEVEDFSNIVIRTAEQGGLVKISDIARVEIGKESYGVDSEFDNAPATTMAVNMLSGANALATMKLLKAELKRMETYHPDDIKVTIGYDATRYIQSSINEVIETLVITFILVILVCYIFLQDWRATIIPSLTIPVSIFATFAVLAALGFSINMFTLFALVLSIGLVVDDAIVVVERVLYLVEYEKLGTREATYKAMDQVSSPIIATTLVLLAIFVPVGFLGGITGRIYAQFAVTISTAIIFSGINALTLSPALCAVFLKPIKQKTSGPLYWFDNFISNARSKYVSIVAIVARKISVIATIFGLLILGVWGFLKISQTSFIPNEDQGVLFASVQLPEGASSTRTKAFLDKVYKDIRAVPGVSNIMVVTGASIIGGHGENTGMTIVILDPWAERKSADKSSTAILNKIRAKISQYPEAEFNIFELPAIPGLGTSGGMDFRLQAISDADYNRLDSTLRNFLGAVNQSPAIMYAFSTYTAQTPHVFLDIDRKKAEVMNVPLGNLFSTLGTYLGSAYINDVNFGTQVNRVIVQSDLKNRSDISSIYGLYVQNQNGDMVPLGSLIKTRKVLAPRTVERYNQYPSAAITAVQNPTVSSGEAMAAMEKLAKEVLPEGYGYEWSSMSFQEQSSQGQIGYLIILAVIFGYLFLVAQYESWMTPIPVLASVTTAMLGALLGLFIHALSLSIYAQLGLILLVGLAAKNAILIVEFSREEEEQGASVIKAALIGLKERYRAVLMTAFTFILGMVPLLFATGAGAASRFALGVPVFYGMLMATLLGLLIIPMLYILFQTGREKYKGRKTKQ